MKKCIYLNRTFKILGVNSLKYFLPVGFPEIDETELVRLECTYFFIVLRFTVSRYRHRKWSFEVNAQPKFSSVICPFFFIEISWRSHWAECRRISNDLKRMDSWCCWLCFKFLLVSVGVQRVLCAMLFAFVCVWVCILCVVFLVGSSNCFIYSFHFAFFAVFPCRLLSLSLYIQSTHRLHLHMRKQQILGTRHPMNILFKKNCWKNNKNEMENHFRVFCFVLLCFTRYRTTFIQMIASKLRCANLLTIRTRSMKVVQQCHRWDALR